MQDRRGLFAAGLRPRARGGRGLGPPPHRHGRAAGRGPQATRALLPLRGAEQPRCAAGGARGGGVWLGEGATQAKVIYFVILLATSKPPPPPLLPPPLSHTRATPHHDVAISGWATRTRTTPPWATLAVLVAADNLEGPVMAVLGQLKIVTTALFSVTLLKAQPTPVSSTLRPTKKNR